jgi:hypothetical protein
MRNLLSLGLAAAFLLAAAPPVAAADAPEPETTTPPEIQAVTTDAAGRGSPNGSSADPDFIDGLTVSAEPAYGSQEWPVTVGGFLGGNGHQWSKQYFASLLGPNGEPTTYERVGSCCRFEVDDPKLLADNIRSGFLDVYEVRIGDGEPVRLYVSLYHEYKIFVPPGFTPRRKAAVPEPRTE